MFELLSLHRRAYNLAIEDFIKVPIEDQLKVTELRKLIKTQVKMEFKNKVYTAEVVGEVVRVAFKTKNALIAKRSRGEKCRLHQAASKSGRFNFRLTQASSLRPCYKI